MRVLLLAILAFLLFSACSEQKQCVRFIEKHPTCFQETRDTVIKYDTIHGIKHDTIFKGFREVDTFLVDSGGIKVKTIVKWRNKTIYQDIIQKDTIVESLYIERKSKPIIIEKNPSWLNGALTGLLVFIALLLVLVYIVFKKISK